MLLVAALTCLSGSPSRARGAIRSIRSELRDHRRGRRFARGLQILRAAQMRVAQITEWHVYTATWARSLPDAQCGQCGQSIHVAVSHAHTPSAIWPGWRLQVTAPRSKPCCDALGPATEHRQLTEAPFPRCMWRYSVAIRLVEQLGQRWQT